MHRPLGTVVFAVSVWAAALALPATAYAKDDAVNATAAAVSSPAAAARAEVATPRVKRVRKVGMRRVAAVAPPTPYHSQCFLFWCGSGGRPFHWVVLGVAY
jgi:hypothetical protein